LLQYGIDKYRLFRLTSPPKIHSCRILCPGSPISKNISGYVRRLLPVEKINKTIALLVLAHPDPHKNDLPAKL
jgi:hypothetical protein